MGQRKRKPARKRQRIAAIKPEVLGEPNKGGRPRAFTDELWNELLEYLRWNLSLMQCMGLLEVTQDTIENEVQRRTGMGFSDFREQKAEIGIRLTLFRKIMDGAYSGNTPLLIFAAKNILGWKDSQDVRQAERPPDVIKITYQDELDGSTPDNSATANGAAKAALPEPKKV